MKKVIKVKNPKFYLGHYKSKDYEQVDCLFNYENKTYSTLYLIEHKEGAKEKYYIAKAKKLYKNEIKNGQIIRAIKPHYYRNRNLIIAGSVVVFAGLITLTTLLLIKPALPTFDYFKKQDGTYEILEYRGNDKDVVIPETYNGAPVTSIGSKAFRKHYELETVCLSNNLVSIGDQAFFGDSSLVSVTFPTSNTSPSLKTISAHAFCDCYELKNLYLPDSLHEIGTYAFQNDRALTDVFIPRSTMLKGHAFDSCNNLTFYIAENEIPADWSVNWNFTNRPYILGATRDTPSQLTIRNKLVFVKKDNYAEIAKFDETEGELPKQLDIPTTVEMNNVEVPVKSINENAFASTPKGNVRWLIIPEGITYIGPNAFKELTNTLVFVKDGADTSKWSSDWDNGVLKSYTRFWMIQNEGAYTYANIYNNEEAIVLDGQPDASGTLTISDSFISAIAPKAFANRSDIKKIVISGDNFTSIGEYAFANCYNLKTANINNNYRDLSIGSHAFYTTLYNAENNGLIHISITTNQKLFIADSAFEKGYKTSGPVCTVIQELSLSSIASIGQSAFKGCQFFNGITISLDDDCTKPANYAFLSANSGLVIRVSPTLFSRMQDEWGWPLDQNNVLSLHTVGDKTYQLYTYWSSSETKTYERFGQAQIVVL